MKKIVEQIVELIANSPMDVEDISEQLNVKKTVVSSTLNRLKNEGLVTSTRGRVGSFRWSSKNGSSTTSSTPHVGNGRTEVLLALFNRLFMSGKVSDLLTPSSEVGELAAMLSSAFTEISTIVQDTKLPDEYEEALKLVK
jgi:DeoR/GlpR family transcriptional regulator of sugar metabolism